MSEERFDVAFYGILQPGRDRETVMQNMAALFKTDAARLAPYFAGGRKVIKARVNEAIAEKYRAALENAGLIIKIEPCSEPTPTGKTGDSQKTASVKANTDTPPEEKSQTAKPGTQIDTSGMTVAPVGADVIENPVEPVAAEIGDISNISMAQPGADVIENPVKPPPAEIGDISDISMAEPGADVLENPPQVTPQAIADISDLSLAGPGADIIENPTPEKKARIPDTSDLSLDQGTSD